MARCRTQTTITRKNAQGLVSQVVNGLGKTTSYVYDAYGDVLTVTDPVGNRIVNTYDLRGNKLSSSDPDLGLWTYSYDALGELLTQVDPNERAASASTALIYDGLGRLTQRTEPDQTSVWTYDTATHGAGLLASATGSNAGYGRTHAYDSLSRPAKVTLTINAKSYVYNRSYNSDGRIATLSYPSGLVVQYVYTPLGYLSQLKDNATGAVLWTANARDAEMHLTDQLAGNGVDTLQVFDPNTGLVQQIRASGDGSDDGSVANFSYQFDKIGNLLNRADNYGATEQFCYDVLNRLTNYSVNGASCRAGGLLKTVAYDDPGNIALKSDLADTSGGTGAYAYANPGNPLPHAVKSISGTANGVKDPNFRYDANGNLTCEYTGPNCAHGAITKETDAYWSFNMAHTVAEGSTSLTLAYDSEHARITQALTTASTTTTMTYLNDPINGAMGERVATGSTVTWNDYLMVDGKLIGEKTCTASAPTCTGGATLQYFVLDHLGSVAVVTDGSGAVTARESFDAWGKQRNENGSDDATCSNGLTSPTTRGFTSQEEIAALCLVNLNARIYDPTIARFMAADTMVPDAYDGQSYNRYTYTDNRPLSFTDTTGHDPSCIGVCGSWNPGSQANGNVDQSAHPEMEVLGSFSISESGNLADGVNAIHITYNVSGESVATQDPTKGEVSMSARSDETQNRSNCDPKTTAMTQASQNAASSTVTSETDDTQNGNGLGRGYHVSVSDVQVDPFILQAQGFQSGSESVRLSVDHDVPMDSVLIQHVHTTYFDASGKAVTRDQVPSLGPSEMSEAFPVPHDKSAPARREGDLGKDDIFGATKLLPAGFTAKVDASIRLYVGTTVQDLHNNYSFNPGPNGGAKTSGDLYSKEGSPGVPVNNAGAVTIRTWPH